MKKSKQTRNLFDSYILDSLPFISRNIDVELQHNWALRGVQVLRRLLHLEKVLAELSRKREPLEYARAHERERCDVGIKTRQGCVVLSR